MERTSQVTKNLARYVAETGIRMSTMSKKTGIPYAALHDSLINDSRDRDLRVGEFFKICEFLKKNPMDFAEEQE